MQLMSIFIIVIDTILNSERLLVVLSLLLQSLSNDSYCLNILWFILDLGTCQKLAGGGGGGVGILNLGSEMR